MPPAARLGDMHTCPMVDPGPKPHVGGPILPPCCPTVIIGGQPAARVTDLATCVGPPDSIAKGSPTVIIGNLLAARLGDSTVHGGVIVQGFPTVLIGESGSGGAGGGGGGGAAGAAGGPANLLGMIGGLPVTLLPNGDIQVGKNLIITGSPEFKSKALADLGKIGATKTGQGILAAIDNGTHKVTLKELDLATARRNGALAGPTDPAGSIDPTKGSDTTISYNPDVKLQLTDAAGSVDVPVQLILGHEMIHAVHNDTGTNQRNTPDPLDPTGNMEESRTIGINGHENEPLSERNLGQDLGVGFQRTDHDGSFVRTP